MPTEPSRRPTILIVEDEDVLRLTFERFLTDEGHCVRVAADFDEAVACLDEVDIDVIVSDILLGGKTGIDLLKVVRDEQPQALVIMITGEPSVKTASETVRLGAFDYLKKPVTGPDLQRIVRLALEQRRVTRERAQFAARMDQYRRD
ncbi:MAG: response regulator, partial [Planctomycetes bacterium]|nr:response regulator [Planctomycetota bacterium]